MGKYTNIVYMYEQCSALRQQCVIIKSGRKLSQQLKWMLYSVHICILLYRTLYTNVCGSKCIVVLYIHTLRYNTVHTRTYIERRALQYNLCTYTTSHIAVHVHILHALCCCAYTSVQYSAGTYLSHGVQYNLHLQRPSTYIIQSAFTEYVHTTPVLCTAHRLSVLVF